MNHIHFVKRSETIEKHLQMSYNNLVMGNALPIGRYYDQRGVFNETNNKEYGKMQ